MTTEPLQRVKLPWRCRWFGHKWTHCTWEYCYTSHRCFRCGLNQAELARLYTDEFLNGGER